MNALKARKLFRDKTTLIATHRLSLVGLCDRVILMDRGHVLAFGAHEELLASQPLYRRLHRLQALRETLGDWDDDEKTTRPAAVVSDWEEPG